MFLLAGVLSPSGVLLDVGRAALRFAGVRAEEVIDLPFWEAPWWSDAETPRLRQAIALAAGGGFVRYEAEIRGTDEQSITIDFTLTPIRDDAGQVHRLVVGGRDVSEYHRVLEALRISEAKFSGIVAVAADAIVTVDEQQRILLFNAGAEEIFGWTAQEVAGQLLDVLLPESVRERHREHIAEFERSGQVARRMGDRREIFGRRKDGSVFPAEASISRVQVDGRRFFTSVLRDVSERKQVEQELQRLLAAERQARSTAEAHEARSRLLAEASAAFDRTLEYEETLRDVVHLLVQRLASFALMDLIEESGAPLRLLAQHARPDKAELERRFSSFVIDRTRPFLLKRALEEGVAELYESVTDEQLQRICQGPEHLDMLRDLEPQSYMVVPLTTRGHVLGAVALVADASRPAYTEADLRMAVVLGQRAGQAIGNARLYRHATTAIRLREEMLGIVSHDLRNPLSAISMCASVLLESPPATGEECHDMLQTISDSAEWAQRMIADLLDVASIESGQLALDLAPVRVAGLMQRAVELFEGVAREKDIELSIRKPGRDVVVHGDAERLLQVLANLIGNAMKFTAAGGHISLALRVDDDSVELSVSDTGAGIPGAHLPHLFDRFWQARRSASTRGTGLGLSICRGLVEAHGGQIVVESVLGQGTTARVTLPRGA